MISIPFFAILLFSAILYWSIPNQNIRNMLLCLASLYYIYTLDVNTLVVVIGLTLYTYGFGILLDKKQAKRKYLFIGIVGLLLVLIIFKYLGMLEEAIHSILSIVNIYPKFEFEKLFLPIGLSYILFRYISYLVDIYWRLIKPGRFVDFLCYGCLLTTYIAGPIDRFERIKPQLEKRQITTFADMEYAFKRIVFGLFKKLVLADWISYYIRDIWNHPVSHDMSMNILALLGFSWQIYFDFSGYSDIAIGTSRIFGIRVMENFTNPYLKPNISQFWRSWHISLSDWIRDYLFFPLSQMRKDKFWNLAIVPLIAMGLCGLWHGASWNYVLWGLWHGMGIAILQYWNQYKRKNKAFAKITKKKWFYNASIVLTYLFVTVGWWWFR